MSTDETLYEWAKRAPSAVAELAGLPVGNGWLFRSETLKKMERRMDGVLEPVDGMGPVLFVEFQGYRDRGLLLRWLQGIVPYLAQKEDTPPMEALAVYLEAGHEVGHALTLGWRERRVVGFEPRVLVLGSMEPEELSRSGNVEMLPLLPLTHIPEEDLKERVPVWARSIRESGAPQDRKRDLLALLGLFLSHKLKRLGREDIEKMMGGLPMRDTNLAQSFIEEGREEGRLKGREEGREEGRTSEARSLLRMLAAKRFGMAPAWLEAWAERQRTPEPLEKAMEELLEARSVKSWKAKVLELGA